jgi:hypothetical protein
MTGRRGVLLRWSDKLDHGHRAFAAVCRGQANRCVRRAQGSNNLREIVRLTAQASILESVGRKLHSSLSITPDDMARISPLLSADSQPTLCDHPSSRTSDGEGGATSDEI